MSAHDHVDARCVKAVRAVLSGVVLSSGGARLSRDLRVSLEIASQSTIRERPLGRARAQLKNPHDA